MAFASPEALAAIPELRGLIQRWGAAPFLPHPVEPEAPFPALARAIVGQQLSRRAARAIWQRLSQMYGQEPSAYGLASLEELRAAGLSRSKALSLKALAQAALEGRLNGLEARSEEELYRALTQLPGIGPWTVAMFLMFGLKRPDVWPWQDLGLRQAASRLFGVGPNELPAFGERFRPFRSHAAWYLWRSLEP